MIIKKTLLTAIVTSSLLFTPLLSGVASADTVITGNGAYSDNAARVSSSNNSTAVQDNVAHVSNEVQSNLNTGGNSANNLTGGDAAIRTGDAFANTNITNQLNSNQAMLMGGNTGGNGTTFVGGNGAFSASSADSNNNNSTSAFQHNQADVNNSVSNNENTGRNYADNLTGGSAAILTGNASAQTDIFTAANRNMLDMHNAGNGLFGNGGNVVVAGNGTGSENTANTNSNSANTAVQDNNAWIGNHVGGDLSTGRNSSNNDTGAGAAIRTGSTWAGTNLDTMVNSNSANIDGMNGFGGDLNKIQGNGAFSSSALHASSENTQSQFQHNTASVENSIQPNLSSGKNQVDNATGGLFFFTDPSIFSGNTAEQTTVSTSANRNVLSSFDMGGQQFNLSFDPSALLGFLH